jgi:ribonuclease HI
MRAKAICDGRGNSGTGARAAVLELENGRVIEKAERLSPCTNIVAEHLSIQLAIKLALQNGVTHLVVFNDSQTPVRHISGEYRVSAEHLLPIVEETWRLGCLLERVSIQWVRREHTLRADELCREVDRDEGLDPSEWDWKHI